MTMQPPLYVNELTESGVPSRGYVVVVPDSFPYPVKSVASGNAIKPALFIDWQNGPVKEVGENGVQPVDVLQAVLQRIEMMNDHFPCTENDETCDYIRRAIVAQNDRTARRTAEGVEGTSARGAGDINPDTTVGHPEIDPPEDGRDSAAFEEEAESRQLDHEEAEDGGGFHE